MMNKENVAHRINEFIKTKSLSVNKFEEICGVTQGKISKAIKTGTEFQFSVLEKIAEKFPELSMDWIIANKGTMILDGNAPEKQEKPPSDGNEWERKYYALMEKYMSCMEEKDSFKKTNVAPFARDVKQLKCVEPRT